MVDEPREPRQRAVRTALAAVAIGVLLAAAYAPSLGGGFLWDDDAHVVDNPQLRDLAGLLRIWIPGHTPQYYPVTFSVFWLAYQLWGLCTLGYDLLNLALHGLNAWLVWRLLRLLGAPAPAGVAAAFALHPLHVESVAWVMELKNTLSGAFYLAAAICYVRFDGAREEAFVSGTAPPRARRDYALALLLFALALLSKSVTATLPAALVLMLVQRGGGLSPRRLAPLAPLLALGLGLALHTAWLERELVGARGAAFDFTLAERALIASKALLFYAQKLLVPERLLFCHPRWEIPGAPLAAYWPIAAVAAVAGALLLAFARGRRGAPLALAFYAGSLFPALGFIDFYPMVYSFVADHFAYLPSLGVIAAAVGGAARALRGERTRVAAAVALAVALAGLTHRHAAHFRDAQSLYRHSAERNPQGTLCLGLLGTELIRQAQAESEAGRAARARALFAEGKAFSQRALALDEGQHATHVDLAVAHFALGEGAQGIAHALRAAELAPGNAEVQRLAAGAQELAGRRREAAAHLQRALALEPAHAPTALRLARLLAAERPAEAARLLRSARAGARADEETRREAALQLAWLLATSADEGVRAPGEALALAGELQPRGPRVVRAEAAALAALGRHGAARARIAPLIPQLRAAGQPELADALAADLARYARGESLRE